MTRFLSITFCGFVRLPKSGRRFYVVGHKQEHIRKENQAVARAASREWLEKLLEG